jgi:hypothetical protein
MGEHVGEIFDLQLVRDSLSGIISGLVVIVIVSVISRKAWRWWNRKHQNRAEGQSQQDSPHSYQQSTSGAGRDIHQAGRDIVLGQQTAPQVLQPWLRRPGAPRFRMHPGINPPRQLLNRFDMQADVTPANMQARWVGCGINMDFVTPMPQTTPNQYQMKGVQMEPEGTEDIVTFEVRFWLEDGEHGGRWKWPVLKHSKGHLEIHTELGSGVNQPKLEDIW